MDTMRLDTPVKAPSSNVGVRQDPLWAQGCVLIGAMLSAGAGAFVATLALSGRL